MTQFLTKLPLFGNFVRNSPKMTPWAVEWLRKAFNGELLCSQPEQQIRRDSCVDGATVQSDPVENGSYKLAKSGADRNRQYEEHRNGRWST